MVRWHRAESGSICTSKISKMTQFAFSFATLSLSCFALLRRGIFATFAPSSSWEGAKAPWLESADSPRLHLPAHQRNQMEETALDVRYQMRLQARKSPLLHCPPAHTPPNALALVGLGEKKKRNRTKCRCSESTQHTKPTKPPEPRSKVVGEWDKEYALGGQGAQSGALGKQRTGNPPPEAGVFRCFVAEAPLEECLLVSYFLLGMACRSAVVLHRAPHWLAFSCLFALLLLPRGGQPGGGLALAHGQNRKEQPRAPVLPKKSKSLQSFFPHRSVFSKKPVIILVLPRPCLSVGRCFQSKTNRRHFILVASFALSPSLSLVFFCLFPPFLSFPFPIPIVLQIDTKRSSSIVGVPFVRLHNPLTSLYHYHLSST